MTKKKGNGSKTAILSDDMVSITPEAIHEALGRMRDSMAKTINQYMRAKTLDVSKIRTLHDADKACHYLMCVACDLIRLDDFAAIAQQIYGKLPTVATPNGPQVDVRVVHVKECEEILAEIIRMVMLDRTFPDNEKLYMPNILLALYDAVRARREVLLEEDNIPPDPEDEDDGGDIIH